MPKPCKEGKVRNPKTGRCVNRNSPVLKRKSKSQRKSRRVSRAKSPRKSRRVSGSKTRKQLTPEQKAKFERCVLKVKARQSPDWQTRSIKSYKYNPYAICHHSLGY